MSSGSSFRLSRTDKDHRWIVEEFTGRTNNKVPTAAAPPSLPFLGAPLRCVYLDMPTILELPTFHLEGTDEILEGGEKLLRLKVRYQYGRLSPHEGWILVAPEKSWAIREYRISSGRKDGRDVIWAGKVEYGRSVDGVPIPKRALYTIPISQGQGVRVDECIFEEFVPGPTPREEFTLAAFGLPELGKPESNRYSAHSRLWLLLAAVVCLALGVGLRMLSRREERRRSD
jgi:hypothetical protein